MTAESENWTTAQLWNFSGAIWRQCIVYVTATKKNTSISTKKSCL